uniref:Uncharacterized protein n=1 Tax=Pyrodinium bahamense TaxID=73915 RepID=A0A7S0AIT4_9DINO
MEGTMAELFQRFAGGGRECSLFDGPVSTKVDALAVCHEVRCVQLAPGERTCASFRVLGRHGREDVPGPPGEPQELPSLRLDEVVLLRVWAALGEEPAAPDVERRACGEARIPLRHIVTRCDGLLYRTWIALDSPGLCDSMASMGHVSPASDGEAFDQALSNACRQAFQPKACITICKAEDLGSSRQALWTVEASQKERIARWGALLRSQKQHVLLSTTQHLHSMQAHRDRQPQVELQLQELEGQARAQAQEHEALRERLQSRQEALQLERELARSGRRRSSLRELEEKAARQLEESRELAESAAERAARRSREAEVAAEAERQRALGDRLRQELEVLEEELASIRQEAKDKMEAADANIRVLRGKREDAARLAEQQKAENLRMLQEVDQLRKDKVNLAEQKEELMKIVEDLHQTCDTHGLTAGTDAIHSITHYRFP